MNRPDLFIIDGEFFEKSLSILGLERLQLLLPTFYRLQLFSR
ncbi:MAG: hypothetical protein PSX80_07505 [bacterium]|nr:hypothetical protein [bacterium]